MADLTPLILPPTTYTKDQHSSLTEHLQWYGEGKLHPTHLGDTLSRGRYLITHKLDHTNHSLSWLARDTTTQTWRRIDIVHAAPEVSSQHATAADAQLRERARLVSVMGTDDGSTAANEKGLALDRFVERGPNGTHVCMVFPLNGAGNCFRWGAGDACVMDEAWFLRQCAKLRAGGNSSSDNGVPRSVHEIEHDEMLRILGRPRFIQVSDELRRMVHLSSSVRGHQVPRYLVLRPEPLVDEIDFWLSPQAFHGM